MGGDREVHTPAFTDARIENGRMPSFDPRRTVLIVWLVPAFAFTAGGTHWDPLLIGSLAAIAITSYFSAVALRTTTTLDGAFIAALVAVVLLGPLPAACIWIATEIGAFFVLRRRPEAFVANTASFAAATLAAAAVLAVLVGELPADGSLGAAGYAAVAIAGVAMLIENFIVGAILIDVLRDRRPLLPVVRTELLATAPATAAMIAIGTATVFLYSHIGVARAGPVRPHRARAPAPAAAPASPAGDAHPLPHARRRRLRAGDRVRDRPSAQQASRAQGRGRVHARVSAATPGGQAERHQRLAPERARGSGPLSR